MMTAPPFAMPPAPLEFRCDLASRCSSAATGADDVVLLRCWQHGLAVATLMDRLTPADDTDSAPVGLGYVVGLCHDLTDIVLRQYFHDEHARISQLVADTGRPRRLIESIVFGLPYHELAVT